MNRFYVDTKPTNYKLKIITPKHSLANLFQMHEVAVATTITYIFLILSTCSFTKVSDWREVNNDRTP